MGKRARWRLFGPAPPSYRLCFLVTVPGQPLDAVICKGLSDPRNAGMVGLEFRPVSRRHLGPRCRQEDFRPHAPAGIIGQNRYRPGWRRLSRYRLNVWVFGKTPAQLRLLSSTMTLPERYTTLTSGVDNGRDSDNSHAATHLSELVRIIHGSSGVSAPHPHQTSEQLPSHLPKVS